MNIEKRKLKDKTKYYLSHSIRAGDKFRKVRIYLGNNSKDAMKNIQKAENKIKERIRAYENISDPFQTALSKKELDDIKTLEAKGNIKIKHLNEDEWKIFIESFVYDTNAIEGSTVTLNEVEDILEKNHWPKERQKWEVSETYGLSDAVKYIRNTNEHISLNLIKELHWMTFKSSKHFAGEFRKPGQEVAVVDGYGNILHRGAPSSMVIRLLESLVQWYNKNRSKYPPIVLAAVAHNQFECIHPFADGNGRVGRLLLNNILLRHNKPPVNIQLKNRKEYYAALQEYEHNNNIRPTIELILKEYNTLRKIITKKHK